MRDLARKMTGLNSAELGQTLIETLVALVILGMVAIIFLSGLAIASKSVIVSEERVTAENLAKSQMENIKKQNYKHSGSYSKIYIAPELQAQGYDIELPAVEPVGSGLQKVTVVVSRNGEEILEIEGYKLDR